MWSARIASMMALVACALTAQIAPQKVDEARRLSQGWRRQAGGRERGFNELTPKDQLEFLIGTARDNHYAPNRDAALILLTQWPYEQGLAKALENNWEGAAALSRLGYTRPPANLAQASGPARPWIRGLGLHLDPQGWRLQVIPAPEFMAAAPGQTGLPAALRTAPIPSVLVRLDQLRPGLSRLAQLAGGPEGRLLQTASAGSRAGFLLAHVQAWMAKGDPALAPLADRPAWILHYGVQRPRETRPNQIPAPEGTLVFLPGSLPGRTNLALGLLRLNPFSSGARVRKAQLKDGVVIDVLHGAGGVLYLQENQDGTWLADRLSALEAREQGFDTTLAQADGWGRVAMAGVGRASASLWMIPRQAPLDSYASGPVSAPGTAVPASLLKASPRGSGAVMALGAGPTTRALQAFFSVDLPFEVPVPQQPTLAGGAVTLSPEQQKSFQDAQEEAKRRSSRKAAMRRTLDRLLRTLDGQGAAMHWNGWTAAPPISEADKAALQAFRKQGYWISVRKERINRAPGFGGFGEPGFTPSLAFALPLRPGSGTEADTALKALFLQAFRGTLETRMVGPATLRRVRTVQAFAPSFAVAGDLLVLATDDAAAATVLAGLQGQAPTLADLPPSGWGQVELDGSRIATDLEQLLLAYLGAQSGKPRRWWEPESAAQTGDEVSEEVAATFGPFLNLVKQQGRVRMSVTPGGSGFELRPL